MTTVAAKPLCSPTVCLHKAPLFSNGLSPYCVTEGKAGTICNTFLPFENNILYQISLSRDRNPAAMTTGTHSLAQPLNKRYIVLLKNQTHTHTCAHIRPPHDIRRATREHQRPWYQKYFHLLLQLHVPLFLRLGIVNNLDNLFNHTWVREL
jgi:hypothetical protein